MSEPTELLTVEETDGGMHLVRLVPSKMLDGLEISAIGDQLTDLIDNGARKMVIDFSSVQYMSSSALGVLITVRQRLNEVNGSVRLCNIRAEIHEVFKITNLDRLFSIFSTAAEALASSWE